MHKTITFVVLVFVAVGALSIGSAGYSVRRIEQQLTGALEVHTGLHAQILTISQSFADAVQESLAYVLSGEVIEKDEAIDLHASLTSRLQAYAEDVQSHAHQDGSELALIVRTAGELDAWVALSETMFREYEATGSVSPETFTGFETAVDAAGLGVASMVQIERTEMDAARSDTFAVIAKAQQLILAQAVLLTLVILLAAAVVARVLHAVFTNPELLQAQLLQSQKMEAVGQLARSFRRSRLRFLRIFGRSSTRGWGGGEAHHGEIVGS